MSGNENQPGLWDEPVASEPTRDHSRPPRAGSPAATGTAPSPPRERPEIAQLWTVDDVSTFLGVPKATIHGWRTAGKGPKGFRVGKHLRWHPRTVFEWSLRLEDEQ